MKKPVRCIVKCGNPNDKMLPFRDGKHATQKNGDLGDGQFIVGFTTLIVYLEGQDDQWPTSDRSINVIQFQDR